MNVSPDQLLASGRAADIFDLGNGMVLRRCRSDHDSEPEARLMRWLRNAGYPVPAVHDAHGRDLVMEHIDGPTLLDDMVRHPVRMRSHARLLARLQRSLNAIPAPAWLATAHHVPAGDAVLHLDLHPLNVMLSPDGPVVIDWTNASRGPRGFDAATTYVLLTTASVEGARERLGRRVVTRAFARACEADFAPFVEAAARRRLSDHNLTPRERAAVSRLRSIPDDD